MESIFGILTPEQAREIRSDFGTPIYVYRQELLEKYAEEILHFPHAYGITVRYAMKALPTKAILQLFDLQGIHIDASSGYEAERAIRAGISPEKIQLTAQEIPSNLEQLVEQGIIFNACSLQQLKTFGQLFPGKEVSIRINPGRGSGTNAKVNVGGSDSSFGIWHQEIEKVYSLIKEYDVHITKIHTHIGSGNDLEAWQEVAKSSLAFVEQFPEATTLNLGGGFKVARVPEEKSIDLHRCGEYIQRAFEGFHSRTGRKIKLEIEPGTYLVTNAGAVLSTIQDIVSTNRYTFLKVDSGMTEVTRPALYGAQHPLAIVPLTERTTNTTQEYVVVGHCCESGDLWTPAPGNAEKIQPRVLPEAKIGDLLVLGGAGAYCSGMSTKNYNSFPEAAEVLIRPSGIISLIRGRQNLEQITQNELDLK